MANVGNDQPKPRDWYRIENKAGAVAKVYIYDEIGWLGVTADQFVKDLADITAGQIDLHLNSPGGSAFEGIAIYNALRNHPAQVTTRIDSLAASAASFIAMAGDKVVIEKTGQMMIHDAFGLTAGNAVDHRATADLLDKMSDNIAGIYSDRAGGSVSSWRDRMRGEVWYSADEAVKAGLADEVAGGDEAREGPENRWDLSIFQYAGRSKAPPPLLPVANQAPAPVPPSATPAEPEPANSEQDVPFAFDPQMFRAVMADLVDNAPAPLRAAGHEEAPPPEFVIDPTWFHNAVREAVRS